MFQPTVNSINTIKEQVIETNYLKITTHTLVCSSLKLLHSLYETVRSNY